MKLREMLDPDLFDQMLAARCIRVRRHDTLPLAIVGYTEHAQFRRVWNEVTRACRGIIFDTDTDEVVARSMGKFFNYGEPDADPIGDGPVLATDKMDGSLGICFPVGDGTYAISTRGSLQSPQGELATRILHSRYAGFTPVAGWTYLFEIIAPITRVVVNYGGHTDLHLIGAVHTDTGRNVDFDEVAATWPGPTVEVLPYQSLVDALAAPPRPNAEGIVVLNPATGARVKIKQADYKRMHAVITGLRKLDLWVLLAVEATRQLEVRTAAARLKLNPDEVANLRSGDGLTGLIADVPDEMYPLVERAVAELREARASLEAQLTAGYQALGLTGDRKADAMTIQSAAPDKFTRSVWLQMLAGGEMECLYWKHIKPAPTDYVTDWLLGDGLEQVS